MIFEIPIRKFLRTNARKVLYFDENTILLLEIKDLSLINTFGIKLNPLKTILNDNFGKVEVDKFSCEENYTMAIAIKTFTSTLQYIILVRNISYISVHISSRYLLSFPMILT